MFWRKKKDLGEILLNRSGDYVQRSQAALDMAARKEARFLDHLIDALKNDPEPSVRMNSAFAMGELMMKRAKPHLIVSLKEDGSEWVRGFAASALANLDIDHQEIEDLLIELMDTDRDSGARRHYAHSLGMIGSIKAGPILVSILGNELDSGVRADAAEALGILGFQDGYDVVVNAAKNDISGDVRRQATIAQRKLDLDR
ncbi:MAG: HEAT repeat domain-containing protein [Candidatus Heimdallarchaeota archaeon]|nr:HEAT repeat domain-containing protein [Candidatus Heimdallarchaeota archaeon]